MSLLAQLSPLHSNHREGAMPEKASAEMSTDLQKHSCPRCSREGICQQRELGTPRHWELGLGNNADQTGGQQ